jgi:17beta-estradiol 17-dehydrogenase / very-long-chain 3-oxoacyl-CoA reductase
MSSPEELQRQLYKRFSVLSFPIYYLIRAYDLWKGDVAQLVTSLIGTVVIASAVYNSVLFIWGFLRPSNLQRYCHAESGSWALVTGANDGIGRAFADELLERGFNVLLHGRSKEKLERVKKELTARFPRRTVDYVIADAASYDHPERAVLEKVKHLPGKLTILINNVGGVNTTPMFASLADSTPENLDTQLNINDRFPLHVTSLLLPTLKENKPSLIINCGSGAGVLGVPYLVNYAGSKGYTFSFTRALKAEMVCEGYGKDVEVIGLIIQNTRSAGNTSEMPLFTIDARDCAKGALQSVGSGNTLVYTSWRHAVQSKLFGLLPDNLLISAMVPEMRKRLAEEQEKLKKQ